MEYELYHYGILGMKWGIRRYQNKDGTLTAAGRKRYSGSKGKQKLAEDISQIESKVRKLESKKSTSKNVSEIDFLNRMKSGLINNLDSKKIENGEKHIAEMEIDNSRKNLDKAFDEQIFAQRERLLSDAKNGKFEMTFVEAIQNDYDDSGMTEEQINKDVLDRYEQYVYSPSSWLRVNHEYRGLSDREAIAKIIGELNRDFGSYEKIDDPELYELALQEQWSNLEIVGFDSNRIASLIDIVNEEFAYK